ncbi:MAG: hypothetical protein ACRDT0_01245 [Pseudonocardiaceae bacterium]
MALAVLDPRAVLAGGERTLLVLLAIADDAGAYPSTDTLRGLADRVSSTSTTAARAWPATAAVLDQSWHIAGWRSRRWPTATLGHAARRCRSARCPSGAGRCVMSSESTRLARGSRRDHE